MAIVNYPNRITKTVVPAIDREMAKRKPQTVTGALNTSAVALNVNITANSDWQIDSVAFQFSNANARDYSMNIRNGRKVVAGLNDYLWVQLPTTLGQRIILDAGFYNGTELALELQAQLDANTVFAAAGITFTVTYNNTTGSFVITPSAGTIRYLETNNTQTIPNYQSIAGHLFGLTATTAFAANITTDTAIPSLNGTAPIIDETASTVRTHYTDDVHYLSIDQAVNLRSSIASLVVNYTVVYEEIV